MEVARSGEGLKLIFKQLAKNIQPAEYNFKELEIENVKLLPDKSAGRKRSSPSLGASTSPEKPPPKKQKVLKQGNNISHEITPLGPTLQSGNQTPKSAPTVNSSLEPSTSSENQPSGSTGVPQVGKRVRPSKSIKSSSKHQSRTKRCRECSGCCRMDCGSCQSCRINSQFKDQIKIGHAECLKKVCLNPIGLSYDTMKHKVGSGEGYVMTAMMEEQDDGACPFKMIDGKLYDFRCYFCKKLPRAGMANRSELYRHYSLYHFAAQLLTEYGHLTSCPVQHCNKSGIGGKKLADHMGQVHNQVDKYLPIDNRIPLKPKGGSDKKKSRATKSVWVFPDLPALYNPSSRTVESQDLPCVFVDGVEVVPNQYFPIKEADLFVPGSVLSVLDNNIGWKGSCSLCEGDREPLKELMNHLVEDHAFKLDFVAAEKLLDFLVEQQIIEVFPQGVPRDITDIAAATEAGDNETTKPENKTNNNKPETEKQVGNDNITQQKPQQQCQPDQKKDSSSKNQKQGEASSLDMVQSAEDPVEPSGHAESAEGPAKPERLEQNRKDSSESVGQWQTPDLGLADPKGQYLTLPERTEEEREGSEGTKDEPTKDKTEIKDDPTKDMKEVKDEPRKEKEETVPMKLDKASSADQPGFYKRGLSEKENIHPTYKSCKL